MRENCGENWRVGERIHPSDLSRKGQLSGTLTVQVPEQEQNAYLQDRLTTSQLPRGEGHLQLG